MGRSFVPEKLLAWSCLVLFPQFLTQDGAVLGASSGLRMEYLVDRARFVPHPRWAHLHLLRDPPPPRLFALQGALRILGAIQESPRVF